jgi:regulator of nonsense transcripts 1
MAITAGATVEVLASQSPSWAKGAAGRERLVLARKALAGAATERSEQRLAGGASTGEKGLLTGDLTIGTAASVAEAEASESMKMVSRVASKGRSLGGLNKSQVKAAEVALGRRLTLWQGPPGTGKTSTLLR